MRAGLPCRGIKHRKACRQGAEAYLRAAGYPRVVAAGHRWADRDVAQGDPSIEPRAEEGERGDDGAGGAGGPASAGVTPPVRLVPQHYAAGGQPAHVSVSGSATDGQPASVSASGAGRPATAGDASPTREETEVHDDMGDDQSEANPMLEALIVAGVPGKLAKCVRGH